MNIRIRHPGGTRLPRFGRRTKIPFQDFQQNVRHLLKWHLAKKGVVSSYSEMYITYTWRKAYERGVCVSDAVRDCLRSHGLDRRGECEEFPSDQRAAEARIVIQEREEDA
jgi:hypothetical protein